MALLAGELDAIVFASAPESNLVQMLLQTPGIQAHGLCPERGLFASFFFVSPVVLPRGVVDLAANIPARNVRLIAPPPPCSPATVRTRAAAAVCTGGQHHPWRPWLVQARARDFPTSTPNNELPLAQEAERNVQAAHPLLQRYLPFWVPTWWAHGWPWA